MLVFRLKKIDLFKNLVDISSENGKKFTNFLNLQMMKIGVKI